MSMPYNVLCDSCASERVTRSSGGRESTEPVALLGADVLR